MPATDGTAALWERRRLQGQSSWWNILKLTASEWLGDDAMTWAAAVACYTILALAPMLVIAIQVATVMLGGKDRAVEKIQSQVQGWMGSEAAGAIAPMINRIVHEGAGRFAAIVSIGLVILSVGGLFSELQQAMNRIWKLMPRPGTAVMTFVRARVKSVFVMTIAAMMLGASVLVTAWLQNTSKAIGIQGWHLAIATNAAVSIGVLTLLFALLYKTIPDAEIEWRSTAVGAIISAILFEVGKAGLACYFKLAAPSSAYGAAGSLAAVLIWVYYSAQIVFFGAEFTQVYAKTRGHGVQPSKHAQFLSNSNETETGTPSPKPPERKPPRGSVPAGIDPTTDFEGVLCQGLSGVEPLAPSGLSGRGRRVLIPSALVAGVGLAVGALIGGFGAMQARRSRLPAEELDAELLDQRVKRIEKKFAQVSQIKRRLAEEAVNERIDKVAQKVREVARKSRISKRRSDGQGWLATAILTASAMKR